MEGGDDGEGFQGPHLKRFGRGERERGCWGGEIKGRGECWQSLLPHLKRQIKAREASEKEGGTSL